METNLLISEQLCLVKAINELADVHMVTCGNCRFTLLHKINAEKITCPNCKYCSEPCDFPDKWYWFSVYDNL